jgi:hypothetical protein
MKEALVDQHNSETIGAFTQLVRGEQKAVFALAYGELSNVDNAEEIMQGDNMKTGRPMFRVQ